MDEDYVRKHSDSRRASWHFRNQLWLMKQSAKVEDAGYDSFSHEYLQLAEMQVQ